MFPRRKLRSPQNPRRTLNCRKKERKKGKKERNTRDGKWKTPIGFCCVFVKQIKHRFSHRRDGGRRLSRGTDRGGRRTPIEQCKLLLKASQSCAAELKSTVHSSQLECPPRQYQWKFTTKIEIFNPSVLISNFIGNREDKYCSKLYQILQILVKKFKTKRQKLIQNLLNG